jgi:hypothetical protein
MLLPVQIFIEAWARSGVTHIATEGSTPAASQNRGTRENEENYFLFTNSSSPGGPRLEGAERYPVIPESYGHG